MGREKERREDGDGKENEDREEVMRWESEGKLISQGREGGREGKDDMRLRKMVEGGDEKGLEGKGKEGRGLTRRETETRKESMCREEGKGLKKTRKEWGEVMGRKGCVWKGRERMVKEGMGRKKKGRKREKEIMKEKKVRQIHG